ncbi:hypothetical protein K493DRAFT_339711 [Basidiobolus meristosporus CBS 931.73]|uniref:Uncharacterized protein n=1 Tax=Basidiobolus meristosporus CBS 931.73 TaxID=1314790 RepID=A0A1Y1XZH3_9FUNG|nr:hypothetical protein K493DRAFT_339711 [Basidiobolus meristosporus CBS 931.73]|eukprot:ORX90896.1 hypothetical protein K493DRAFT_339711 [Basidiobolus meristosporus CBS 931.73]
MNYPEQSAGNVVHDSMAANPNHHYFDVREVDDVGAQLGPFIERLDALEEKINEAFGICSAQAIQARVSGLESKFNELLGGQASRAPIPSNPTGTPTSIRTTLPQTPTPPTHLTPAQTRLLRTPVSGPMLTTHTSLTPVSQLPSEESAKVKVLLRQFASKAMNYIEKNAVSYTNVNNNVGAITTMKKFEIYDSPAWDHFVEVNFPHVQKNDLKDELVKIVSVKVKNTKARFKKRLSESHPTQRHLVHSQQAQHPEQEHQPSPQFSDTMSDGIMTPPAKRMCTASPLDIKNAGVPDTQEKSSIGNEAHMAHLQSNHQMVAPVSIHLQQPSETDQSQF